MAEKNKYQLSTIRCYFDAASNLVIYKAFIIMVGVGVKEWFNEVRVESGYGITEKDAINDFIRRNISGVLGAVFENKQ